MGSAVAMGTQHWSQTLLLVYNAVCRRCVCFTHRGPRIRGPSQAGHNLTHPHPPRPLQRQAQEQSWPAQMWPCNNGLGRRQQLRTLKHFSATGKEWTRNEMGSEGLVSILAWAETSPRRVMAIVPRQLSSPSTRPHTSSL